MVVCWGFRVHDNMHWRCMLCTGLCHTLARLLVSHNQLFRIQGVNSMKGDPRGEPRWKRDTAERRGEPCGVCSSMPFLRMLPSFMSSASPVASWISLTLPPGTSLLLGRSHSRPMSQRAHDSLVLCFIPSWCMFTIQWYLCRTRLTT